MSEKLRGGKSTRIERSEIPVGVWGWLRGVCGVCGACVGVLGCVGLCGACVRGVGCVGRWGRENIARRFIIRIPW